MIDSSLASILTGAGACGVFCILFVLGLIYPKSVVNDLKAERDAERVRADAERASAVAERDRADAAVAAAQATRDLMAALQAGVAMGQHAIGPPSSGAGS